MKKNINYVSHLQNEQNTEEEKGLWFDYANLDHFWMKIRFNYFNKLISKFKIDLNNSNLSILEIGCGYGTLRKQVESSFSCNVDGVDINIDVLKKNDPAIRGTSYYYNIFEKNYDFKNKYDVILLFDVLEHIENPNDFIDAVLFHLKSNGYLFINVPALNILMSQYDVISGHLRRYTKKELNLLLNENNLTIKKTIYWGLLYVPMLFLRKLLLNLKKRDDIEIVKLGFLPPSKLLNKFLELIGLFESSFVFWQPIGTSIISVSQKKIESLNEAK